MQLVQTFAELLQQSVGACVLCVVCNEQDHISELQTTALHKQERLCWNMCTEFLFVPYDSEEVMQIAPPPQEVLLRVDPRDEDASFAVALADVTRQHVEAFAAALPGTALPSLACDCQRGSRHDCSTAHT